MLVFKYSKQNGAEFISHLDTLRHINKTLIRAKIAVEKSQGFNPHLKIFMSAPIAVGCVTKAEFCFVETNEPASKFQQLFNEFCPGGFKCESAVNVKKNPNLAGVINSCEYYLYGDFSRVNIDEIIKSQSFVVTDKKGERKEVRDRILSLKKEDDKLVAVFSFGNKTLRPDLFLVEIEKIYGAKNHKIEKTKAFCDGLLVEDYLKQKEFLLN